MITMVIITNQSLQFKLYSVSEWYDFHTWYMVWSSSLKCMVWSSCCVYINILWHM